MAIRLNRNEYGSTESYLFHLFNDLGFVDLELSYNYKRADGGIGFSKWIRFDEIMAVDYKEIVPGTRDTKENFLSKVTHRSVLDIEVMFDFDETPWGSTDKEDIKKYATKKLLELRRKGFTFEAFFSGSKSIHCSVMFHQLRDMSKRNREFFKRQFLEKFSADVQKAIGRNMIALEGVPHWKTGIKKEVFNYESC